MSASKPPFKPGQNLYCEVIKPEPGGYSVLVKVNQQAGFLPTQNKLQIGEAVLAQFVCISGSRILLTMQIADLDVPGKGIKLPSADPQSPSGKVIPFRSRPKSD